MPHSQTNIGYNKKCIGGFLGDPIPNSPNSHHENCIVDSKENYLWDLGMKGLKKSCLFTIVMCIPLRRYIPSC